MTGFREKKKGLLRKKEKVAQSVDNSTDCVDNRLTIRHAFADIAYALPCKDCVFYTVKRFGLKKICTIVPILTQPFGCFPPTAAQQGKGVRFASLLLFLSIVLVEIMKGFVKC